MCSSTSGKDESCGSALLYGEQKDGRNIRITPSKEKKVREIIGINTVQDLINGKSLLKPVFEKVCKKEIKDIDFNERLERQRVLVELNSKLFPDYIQDYNFEISDMIKNNPQSGFQNIKSQQLLAGTVYEGYDKKKILEAEVFKGMEKYINQLNG